MSKKTTTRLNLVVIRSLDPSRTVKFYEMLGNTFQKEQHGSGPVHWAADVSGVVLEVYPAMAADAVDKATRLGFEVEHVASLLETFRSSSVTIMNDLKKSKWGLRAVVRDPDGRSVELVQSGLPFSPTLEPIRKPAESRASVVGLRLKNT